jgi:DNA-directed RNA polymerase subunit RPC12/RpoP
MSEDAASTFTCYNCKKKSKYLNRHTMLLMEAIMLDRWSRPETRTYKCTLCGAPNEITMLAMQWNLVGHADS